MFRKVMLYFMSSALVLTMAGCSSKKQDETSAGNKAPAPVAEEERDVTVTLPKSFLDAMEMTPEEFMEMLRSDNDDIGEMKENRDGSVTITMKEEDHDKMMEEMGETIDEQIQEIVDDTQTWDNITAVEANDDYTQFDVTLENGTVGLAEPFSLILFYMMGEMYQTLDGNSGAEVKVNFIDKNGNVLQTASSKDAGQ